MKRWFLVLIAVALLSSGCRFKLVRTNDGEMRAMTQISEKQVQKQFERLVTDSTLHDPKIDLRDGYALISGEWWQESLHRVVPISFRLILSVNEGNVVVTISDTQVNQTPLDDEVVAQWARNLADWMESAARKNKRAELESLMIDHDNITLIWNIQNR